MAESILSGFGILLLLAFAGIQIFGIFRAFTKGYYFLGSLVALGSFFCAIFNMIHNPICTCITSTVIFRNLTVWFMGMFQEILASFSQFAGLTILILAGIYFLLGERSIAPRIFIEFAVNMLLASLWSLMFSCIITFYLCPLICEGSLDLNQANENIWAALRKWLGTG